jgi:23S rRNA (pseudouridine1915-N3)-methyltransferase
MKIQLWSVGKSHDPLFTGAIEDYTKRISRYYGVSWNLIPVPKNAAFTSEPEQKKKEGELILQQLKPGDYLVALDERGASMRSEGLAALLSARAVDSTRQLIFLIGGAFGIDRMVLDRANQVLSLSSLTFPHQLVRLILAEQLYRACTIIQNEKYHHK